MKIVSMATLVAASAVLLLVACKGSGPREAIQPPPSLEVPSAQEVVKSTFVGNNGKSLEVFFDNAKDTATLNLDGQTIVLTGQRPASGIWYKNEQYELRGKGEKIELMQGNKIIFKN